MYKKMGKFFNILHVGGRGHGIGPISDFIDKIGDDADLTIFEADASIIDAGLPKFSSKAKIVSKCLSNFIGKANFYINADARSSSLFKVSDKAINYATPTSWGEHCKIINTIEVDVTTIDELCKIGEIELPHFISLDAQGSECDILERVSKAFLNDLVAVVTEVEFREIYDGQKLFSDQDALMRLHEFNLHHFFNWQYWHYKKEHNEIDEGFPLTAEALYLRDFSYFIKRDISPIKQFSNLARLIMVASYFQKTSYVDTILEYITNNFLNQWEDFLLDTNNNYLISICKG